MGKVSSQIKTALCAVALAFCANAALIADPSQYVNPYMGSSWDPHGGGPGQHSPSVCRPFGMLCWGLDNNDESNCTYAYDNTTSRGFSLLHNTGWLPRAITFVPTNRAVSTSPATSPSTYYSDYGQTNQLAHPGYYRVRMNSGMVTELTTTQRAGLGLFHYPRATPATMLVDMSNQVGGTGSPDYGVYNRVDIDPSTRTISGFWGKATYRMYFVAIFSHSFSAYGTYEDGTVSPSSTTSGAPTPPLSQVGGYVTFNMGSDSVVQVRLGVSFVSVANARANLDAEIPATTTFDQVHQRSRDAWKDALGRISVEQTGATLTNLTKFYTMFYFMLWQPTLASDANGQYWGSDNALHTMPSGHHAYSTMMSWDQGRGFWPLIATLFPGVASDAMQSLVLRTQQLPSATMPGSLMPFYDRGAREGFGGNHFVPPAQCYAFGARDFDLDAADRVLLDVALTQFDGYHWKPYGSSPRDITATLEHSIASFSVARMVLDRNPADTSARRALQNSANWFHILHENGRDNGIRGYMARRADGEPFDPWIESTNGTGSSTSGAGCEEASSAQMTYLVPHAQAGLISTLGGSSAYVSRLDHFFSRFSYIGGNFDNLSEAQYMSVANETDIQAPWLYNWAGAANRSQDVVRRIMTTVFLNTPQGLPGNNDWGGMDAWYVSMALGLYPSIPGVGGFAISGPQFRQYLITLDGGKTITMNGANASDTNRYIQSATLNGQPYDSPWIPLQLLVNGAANNTLSFVMGPSPSSWGNAPTMNVPPSFAPSPVKVDDNHSTIAYRGNWATVSGRTGAYGGSSRQSTSPGDTARFTFTGTAITWFGEQRPDGGKADIFVDGANRGTIDCYAGGALSGVKMFTLSNLSFGQHTIAVVARVDRNGSSSGNAVVVDAFASVPIADVPVSAREPSTVLAPRATGMNLRVTASLPALRIQASLPERVAGRVSATVFDLSGRVVSRLTDATEAQGMRTTIELVGLAHPGLTLAKGSYVVRIRADNATYDASFSIGAPTQGVGQ